jgi:hypothetical protein
MDFEFFFQALSFSPSNAKTLGDIMTKACDKSRLASGSGLLSP